MGFAVVQQAQVEIREGQVCRYRFQGLRQAMTCEGEMIKNIQAQFSSESVDWYTPAKYLDAVRGVLNGIELDPASCEAANQVVQASRFFTVEEDGLMQEWTARTVFLNPPYGTRQGRSNQGLWSQKLIAEFSANHIGEAAILLVNASTSEKWFKPLFSYPICFTDHRIRFANTDSKKQPTKGNAFVYFGDNPDLFFAEFSALGTCVSSAAITDFEHAPSALGVQIAPPTLDGAILMRNNEHL